MQHGQRRQAHELAQQIEAGYRRMGLKESEATALLNDVWMDAVYGFPKDVAKGGAAALALAHSPALLIFAADNAALVGDEKHSADYSNQAVREQPESTLQNAVQVPLVRAILELNHGNAAKAIELLKSAEPYDKTIVEIHYVRSRAYLASHQPAKAIQELESVLSLKDRNFFEPLLGLVRLELARAYAQQGDTAKARTAYQDFLALWKDADPDLPMLAQAKAEYAKLQ